MQQNACKSINAQLAHGACCAGRAMPKKTALPDQPENRFKFNLYYYLN